MGNSLSFFMPMIPPTVTAQEHKVTVSHGKPIFYDPPEVRSAKAKLTAYLSQHKPDKPYKKGGKADDKVAVPERTAQRRRVSYNEARYRQSSENAEGLHDCLRFLD